MNVKKYSAEFFGRTLAVEFSDWAEQTSGSVVVYYADTAVLVTAVMSPDDSQKDYLPLQVEYEEKFYAAGKIIGSRFIRREGRPSDEAVLTGRLIDRTVRPLFNQNFRKEIQIVTTVLSLGDTDADWPALIGTSLVLATSNIPWNGPIAGLRVARVDGNFVFNPTFEERAKAEFDAFYSGDRDGVNMMEFSGSSVAEDLFLESIELAQKEFEKLIEFQKKIIDDFSPEKLEIEEKPVNENLNKAVDEFLKDKLEEAIYTPNASVLRSNLTVLKDQLFLHLKGLDFSGDDLKQVENIFEEKLDETVSRNILEKEKRPDSRSLKDVRPLSCEIDVLPRVHGSAVFKRGLTHALSSVTLGGPSAEQMVETIEMSGKRRFIHHYNFPPYSTGEVGNLRRGPGRRELGHGYLAEKSLLPVIPTKDEFPYTIRLVSEILSSNGSSSMASVCGSSLALMAAGVPIKSGVAGIAMGLVLGDDESYKILTDIQGPEDHHGDMDLKVAGTRDGINAIQMDVKIKGISLKILKEALARAKEARLFILDKMDSVLSAPRQKLSPYAPKIIIIKIDPDKIGKLIGPGGKTIQKIIASSGVATIDIDDDGSVFIVALDEVSLQKGVDIVSGLTKEYQIGDIVEGTVSKILDFGAVVDLNEFKDGLLHISELANFRVGKVEDIARLGDKIKVKIINIEPSGKISLSLKALLPTSEGGQQDNSSGFRSGPGRGYGENRGPSRGSRRGR